MKKNEYGHDSMEYLQLIKTDLGFMACEYNSPNNELCIPETASLRKYNATVNSKIQNKFIAAE